MNKEFDYFISYSHEDSAVADALVECLEKRGKKVFIDRNSIRGGSAYDSKIIRSVKSSTTLIFLYSKKAAVSTFCKNEINSAVGNNVNVIPLRLENIKYTDQLHFYIGSIQWIDCFNGVNDKVLNDIFESEKELEQERQRIEESFIETKEKIVKNNKNNLLSIKAINNYDAIKMGYNFNQIIMKEIEIDFLCIPNDKFKPIDEFEGAFEDWEGIIYYVEDISCLLSNGQDIVGYVAMYPVKEKSYAELIGGAKIISPDMTDLYVFGGEFNLYISMIGIIPDYDNQSSYVHAFDWIFNKLAEWKKKNINAKRIGVSVYSDMLEKILKLFGFKYIGLNPVCGKIYEISIKDLRKNAIVKNRYKELII